MIDQFDINETIVAQASAREPGYARGIIRVSGPQTLELMDKSFQANDRSLRDCRSPSRIEGSFSCDDCSAPIPVEVLIWPTTSSYTRQVSAEIHAPGSLPLLDLILHQLCLNGARLAKPGEFTMRAFLSGRMDLTEAEAVLGVIDAQDQKHLNVALKQLSGGLSRSLQAARKELLMTLAHLEAGLDFVEEDIEFVSSDEVLEKVEKCRAELEKLKQQLARRDQSETGLKVVLFGQPNTGKSSLFNQLVARFGGNQKTAIVSDISGTTRDFIADRLTIEGLEFVLVDTAGLEETPFENREFGDSASPLALGQDQSLTQKTESRLILFCLDASRPMSPWEREQLATDDDHRLVCLNKADLAHDNDPVVSSALPVSSLTGQGIQQLADRLVSMASRSNHAESIPATALRCLNVVNEAIDALATAETMVVQSSGDELIAGEIRMALDSIGRITGAVYTDDILDVVFKQFCIGK